MTLRHFALGAAVESLLLGLLLVWPASLPKPAAPALRKVIPLVAPVPVAVSPLPPPPPLRKVRSAPLPTVAALPQPAQPEQPPAPPVLSTPLSQPPPIPAVVPPPAPKPVVGLFESTVAESTRPRQRIVTEALAEPAASSASNRRPAVVSAALDLAANTSVARPRAALASTEFAVQAAENQRARGEVQLSAALEGEKVVGISKRPPVREGAFRPVEILSRPKPAYTQTARQSGVEGEVVLKVRFLATGRLEVLQVLSGLGYGLDENAALAAAQIQFRPAEREGIPVDQLATLRVQFQLAR